MKKKPLIITTIAAVALVTTSIFAVALILTLNNFPSNTTALGTKYNPEILSTKLCNLKEFDPKTGCKTDTDNINKKEQDIYITVEVKNLLIGSTIKLEWKYKDDKGEYSISTQALTQEEINETYFTFQLQKNYDTGWLNGEYSLQATFFDSQNIAIQSLTPINKAFRITEKL